MNIIDLKINLIYSSPLGSYAFNDKNFSLYYEDYEASEFVNCIGGIEFITSGHFIFLQLIQYEEVTNFVNFLIRSLISEEDDAKIRDFFLYNHYKKIDKDSICSLNFNNGERIELNFDNDYIYLSFSNESNLVLDTTRYFSKFLILRNEWIRAVIIALDDYFYVVNNMIDNLPNTILQKKMVYWEEMKCYSRHIS